MWDFRATVLPCVRIDAFTSNIVALESSFIDSIDRFREMVPIDGILCTSVRLSRGILFIVGYSRALAIGLPYPISADGPDKFAFRGTDRAKRTRLCRAS